MSDETNDQPTISDQYLDELQAIPRGKDLVARIIGIYGEETAPGESVVILSTP